MAFYDLPKARRAELVEEIYRQLFNDLKRRSRQHFVAYFSDEDTYIRKTAYQAVGRIYKAEPALQPRVLVALQGLFASANEKVRQTVINSAGEIGMSEFERVEGLMEQGLFDDHHSVRNAVIGSVKKMGEKNPVPVLRYARKYLHHSDKEIRREICHGIELRGRKYPQDILPLLEELQYDETSRVRKTLVHVLGQISYKKGCLETVVVALRKWKNKELVNDALEEIIDVHHRYRNFSHKTQKEAISYIAKHF